MTQLRVAELDFDTIKQNLKDFLRTKPEFTDYDFEGSALAVLMDLLAYNTHYNAIIGNMLVQELYLDTAVKKQSLALIAKRLGYLPKSYRAPKAIVNLEVFPYDSPTSLTIGKNAKFSARVNNVDNAIFVTRDAKTITPNLEGRYIFEYLEIYEGDNATFRYVVADTPSQKFEIPSRVVDTSLIRVYVQQSIGSTDIEEWTNFNSIIDVKADTKAYFIKLNESLNYEVYFGDDVIGKKLSAGNVVTIDYVVTNGPVANNVSMFTFADTVNGYTNVLLTTVTKAFGGALPESNDDIRRNAQSNVLLQNRAVTESDYAAIVNQIIPIETISVYGGETVNPPQYGKVFISAKQIGTTAPLMETRKSAILAELRKRSMMAIVHEFIDPDYTYMVIDTEVKYEQSRTTHSGSTMSALIFNKIKEYGAANLNRFNASFEYSKLVGFIDDIERSIQSNDTKVKLRKEKDFVYDANNIYVFDFSSPLKQSNSVEQNITSTAFRITSHPSTDVFIDDSNGILRIYQVVSNQKVTVVENAGTVDYSTGKVTINLTATFSSNTKLSIEAVPSNKNILPSRNNIITLADQDILVRLKVV